MNVERNLRKENNVGWWGDRGVKGNGWRVVGDELNEDERVVGSGSGMEGVNRVGGYG